MSEVQIKIYTLQKFSTSKMQAQHFLLDFRLFH